MKRIAFIFALLFPAIAFGYPPGSSGLALPSPNGSLVAVVQDFATNPVASQIIQSISIPAGSTAQINFTVTNSSGTAVDLTGSVVLFTVKHDPSDATALVSRQSTITSYSSGVGYFPLVVADTLGLRGIYKYDLTVVWPDGSRNQVVPSSTFLVLPAVSAPSIAVTVPPAQQPLALGPAFNWRGTYSGATSYNFEDVVGFTVGGATSSYIYTGLTPASGFSPTDTNHWTLLAQGQIPLSASGPLVLASGVLTCPNCVSSGSSYADPSWISSLSASKLTTGTLPDAALPNVVTAGNYDGNPFDAHGRLTGWDRQKHNIYNCADYGAVGNGVTDDSTALNACIADAITHQNATVIVPPTVSGYAVSSTISITKALGLTFMGAGPKATVFKWTGAANGTVISVLGGRGCHFIGFSIQGSGSNTTGIAYSGYVGAPSNVASTLNKFELITADSGLAIGLQIGATHFQADQTTYVRCNFNTCTIAGVSIEDANAVLHDFYDCSWQQNLDGITAIRAGTGGSFNLYTAFFAGDTGWDISVYPSSRGTFLSAHAEGGAHFLRTATGSAATTVQCSGCSVNGMTDSTSLGAGLGSMMAFQSSGSVVISGGRFGCTYQGTTCAPQITIASNNNTRTNVLIDGATFESNPLQTTSARNGSIVARGIQIGFTGTASSSSTGWATVDGGVCRGTLAAPIALLSGGGNTLISAACGYVKIASGTTMAKGDNTYQITANNCQGSSRVDVRPISYGGVPSPVQVRGVDAGTNIMQVVVTVPAPFQLTSDMTFYTSCNPEIWSIP